MQGTKHLIECHCVLPQYRNIDNPVYHKFVVFSMLGDGGTVVPKFSQCNNCGVIHKIYDLCKSEIAAGKDELRSVVKADELKISIPSQLWDVLTTYDVDVAILEHIKFIFDYEKWGESVIVSKEYINDDVVGKKITIENSEKFKIVPFLYSSNKIEIL